MNKFTSIDQLDCTGNSFYVRELHALKCKFPLGESVIRITTDDYGADFYHGVITDYGVCDTQLVVVCKFIIDVERTMHFNAKGANTMGVEYGVIKMKKELWKND